MSSQHNKVANVVGKKRIATIVPIRAPITAKPTAILQQPTRTLQLKPRSCRGIASAGSGPGIMKAFVVTRGGEVVYEAATVEWKYSYLLDESGFSVDGNQLVAFQPGDTWVYGAIQLKSRMI